ncbi:hypothetical protein RSSM_05442 [Rhodopirellula sallentina SM41]|uniref:Uncharacterized protein n=1 Tax=Rhodopirellula sallentina SM41 TaxID=1263870 RepID=M5TVC1_9BACT|nr:hypothetical protein RSSM_05442 [Rhodopirellula sallentina SM41]
MALHSVQISSISNAILRDANLLACVNGTVRYDIGCAMAYG